MVILKSSVAVSFPFSPASPWMCLIKMCLIKNPGGSFRYHTLNSFQNKICAYKVVLFYPLQPSHTQLLSENGNEARQHMIELI